VWIGTLQLMSLRLVRRGEWLCGVCGALLFLSLFFTWYKGVRTSVGYSAWQSFGVIDIAILVLAVMAICIVPVFSLRKLVAAGTALTALTAGLAPLVVVAVGYRALVLPKLDTTAVSRSYGLWTGLGLCVLTALCTWMSLRDERFAGPHGRDASARLVTLAELESPSTKAGQ
jgi:multidrug transporter EmrE-like cation transporter